MRNNNREMAATTALLNNILLMKFSITTMIDVCLNGFTTSIFEVLNRHWVVGIVLICYVVLKEEIAKCQITEMTLSRWLLMIAFSKITWSRNFSHKRSIVSLLVWWLVSFSLNLTLSKSISFNSDKND